MLRLYKKLPVNVPEPWGWYAAQLHHHCPEVKEEEQDYYRCVLKFVDCMWEGEIREMFITKSASHDDAKWKFQWLEQRMYHAMCAICAIEYGGQPCHYHFVMRNVKTFGLFAVANEDLLDEHLPRWIYFDESAHTRASLDDWIVMHDPTWIVHE